MIWWALVGMTLITFANRYLFLIDSIKLSPGPRLKRLLSYSIYAVLTAIWAPILFSFNLNQGFSITGLPYLVAAIVAAIMSFLRAPTLLVVIASTGLFFALQLWL